MASRSLHNTDGTRHITPDRVHDGRATYSLPKLSKPDIFTSNQSRSRCGQTSTTHATPQSTESANDYDLSYNRDHKIVRRDSGSNLYIPLDDYLSRLTLLGIGKHIATGSTATSSIPATESAQIKSASGIKAKDSILPKDFKQPLTCFYWATQGICNKSDEDCWYCHYDTGLVAGAPVRVGNQGGGLFYSTDELKLWLIVSDRSCRWTSGRNSHRECYSTEDYTQNPRTRRDGGNHHCQGT